MFRYLPALVNVTRRCVLRDVLGMKGVIVVLP